MLVRIQLETEVGLYATWAFARKIRTFELPGFEVKMYAKYTQMYTSYATYYKSIIYECMYVN